MNSGKFPYSAERGSTMVEWAAVALILVVFLSGFFTLVLPQIQMKGAQAGIEAALLERVSVSPPQLAVVNGSGYLTDGVSLLNETDMDRFNYEAYNFLQSVAARTAQAIEAYGLEPNDFSYCLGVGYKGELITEDAASSGSAPLTRISTALGASCPSNFFPILDSDEAKRWVRIPSLINAAQAESPTLDYFIVVVALDSKDRVCTTTSTCKASNALISSPNPLSAPKSFVKPEETNTPTPVPTPTDTPTSTPTETPTNTPEPGGGSQPTPTPTLAVENGGS